VFVPTIGEFVTPQLVGGTRGFLFGNQIQDEFTRALDWQSGSVLAFFLLLVVAILMAVFGRFTQVRTVRT
jgi:spermidine/putrescine transport system permease protein